MKLLPVSPPLGEKGQESKGLPIAPPVLEDLAGLSRQVAPDVDVALVDANGETLPQGRALEQLAREHRRVAALHGAASSRAVREGS